MAGKFLSFIRRWWPQDGQLHFFYCMTFTLLFTWLNPLIISISAGVLLAVGKEVYDYYVKHQKGWGCHIHDFIYDLLGIIVAVGLVCLIFAVKHVQIIIF